MAARQAAGHTLDFNVWPAVSPIPDKPEFNAFVRSNFDELIRLAATTGADTHEANDIVHEVMLGALQNWEKIHSPTSYIRLVIVKELRRRWWRERREREREQAAVRAGPTPWISDGGLVAREQAEYVAGLLKTLPRRQREVFALHFDGLSTREIADALDLSEAAVRSHLRHARDQLRRTLATQ